MSNIFSQIKVKGVNFSNRIVMAPMVHFGYKNKNGNMEEKLLNTYLNYADKGIGLIISQALLVADKKEIVGDVSNWAGVYSNEHIEYLRKISDIYHKLTTVERIMGDSGIFPCYNVVRNTGGSHGKTVQDIRPDPPGHLRGAAGADGAEAAGEDHHLRDHGRLRDAPAALLLLLFRYIRSGLLDVRGGCRLSAAQAGRSSAVAGGAFAAL